MRSTNFACVVAIALGAQEAFGVEHGEISQFNGNDVRWQQLAKGIFTGVPSEKWDDNYHTMSNAEFDLDEILAFNGFNETSLASRDLSFEGRDLAEQCSAAFDCVKQGSIWFLLNAYGAWVSTAAYYSDNVHKGLFDFLNQPFVANAAGVAIAGIISGQINEATKKECSTDSAGDSQADIIRAAIEAATAANPNSEELEIEVAGPSGTVTIKIKAGDPNTTPALTC